MIEVIGIALAGIGVGVFLGLGLASIDTAVRRRRAAVRAAMRLPEPRADREPLEINLWDRPELSELRDSEFLHDVRVQYRLRFPTKMVGLHFSARYDTLSICAEE